MGTITIGKDGVEQIHTTVIIPRNLRDEAKKQGVSMSSELRKVLEKDLKIMAGIVERQNKLAGSEHDGNKL